jgi:hypothetical protein
MHFGPGAGVHIAHRLVRADSGLGRPVDDRVFEVEVLLDDGADRESEEMRVLVCDHRASCQQLGGGTVKEQLDLQPVARTDAGRFASSPLTVGTAGDELDVRICCTPLPPCSALHHDRCSALTRANGTWRSSSRMILLPRMIGCRRVATHRT